MRQGDGTEPLVTTGPFAETSEALGGFYVLEAGTLGDLSAAEDAVPEAFVEALWTWPERGVPDRPGA